MAESQPPSTRSAAKPAKPGLMQSITALFAAKKKPVKAAVKTAAPQPEPVVAAKPAAPVGWRVDRSFILQSLWGEEGYHLPLSRVLASTLIKPFALNKGMTLADLTAGLGGLTRKAVEEYACYTDGFEPDAELAVHGMDLSKRKGLGKHAPVVAYDLNSLTLRKEFYDCIVMRDLLYRMPDKMALMKTLKAGLKPRGQVAWTDYTLEVDAKGAASVQEWIQADPAKPQPLPQEAHMNLWKASGFDVRVSVDLTDDCKRDILAAITLFAQSLKAHKPIEPNTAVLLMTEIEVWVRRYAALQAGAKYWRFYATMN